MIIFLAGLTNEEKAFVSNLYNKHGQYFFRKAFYILKNKELAEEALANAFIKIMGNIEKASSLADEDLLPYCLTLVKNEAINIIRKDKKHLYTDNIETYLIEDLENKIEAEFILKDQFQAIVNDKTLLKEEERLFLIFRYHHDLTYNEIGKLLNISQGTALKRNQRILEKIRKTKTGGQQHE
ncbi:MAG: sigma-70 family RNA polymerase sigma factor [Bacillota bacterium]|nr:sigma-70 family RNA polymerase sigma factor [Bacillota bacterium]